jgi:hypothetical protein
MTTIPLGSYVKIVALQGGNIAVATYDQNSPGLFKLKGRHFCKSYGEALLHAQLYTAQGYDLRDDVCDTSFVKGGRP